ncbi:MAG: four helix bundle protein [Candidatus Parcubacteria bacterium]|nr:four helix bundle protein [Candidatus Parcubacteria bacterium]
MKEYIKLEDLDIYIISRELSKIAWEIYIDLELDRKIIIGQQFVRCVDSIGANIAEGYGRFHYLDRVKFYYNARASLFESKHFVDLLFEREIIDKGKYEKLKESLDMLHPKLNKYIKHNLDKKSAS